MCALEESHSLSLAAAQTGLQNGKAFVGVPELRQKSGVEGLSSQELCTCYQVVTLHV